MRKSTRAVRRTASLAALTLLATLGLAACGTDDRDPVTVGLITKQEENTYWVTMREIAEHTASDEAVTLLTATGTSDVDVASQEAAIGEMLAQGVDGILIAPTDSTALLPSIEAAREAGIIVIAVDTPVDPVDAVDAYFATDNHEAGRLVGEYAAARAAELGLPVRIAMLDLAPGISSGQERHEGFLDGFGIAEDDPALVAMADSQGDRAMAREAMAQILAEHADITVVYTVNEPAAFGALEALQDSDLDLSRVVLVTIDGGCQAIRDGVRPGHIDATAMQFPENMAREGVRAIAEAVRGGEQPSGFLDTGVQLVSGNPTPAVESRNVEYGVRNCWGG